MKSAFLIAIIILISISSCSIYEPMGLDVLTPAKHSLQPEIKSLLIVDNSVAYRDSNLHKIIVPGKVYVVDTIRKDDFPDAVMSGLKSELERRSFFDSVHIYNVPLRRGNLKSKNAMSWSLIDKIGEKYHAETIITIDDYLYHTAIKVDKTPEGVLNGYLDASGAVLWRAYNRLNRSVMFREVQVDTISWDAYGAYLEQVAGDLPRIRTALGDLAMYMGEKAADYVAPKWVTQQRGYYKTGNVELIQATEYVRKEEWGEAIKLWKYVFDKSKKKYKSRAAYNLALASEVLGDLKSANYWIKQGNDLLLDVTGGVMMREKKRMTFYSILLKKRLETLKKLEIQVGGLK